jgi:L-malate glycosyltransferase
VRYARAGARARRYRHGRAVFPWRQPDVVQSYGFYSNLPAMMAAVLARVPVRIAGRRELGTSLTPAQRRVERAAWRLAHCIVANSDSVRRQIIVHARANPRKIVVIRNGLDLDAWTPYRTNGVAAAEPVVGMIAHLRREKDHTTFLQAAVSVRAVVPPVRFCLIGSGVLETATRAEAVELGIAGFLVPPRAPMAVAERVTMLLSDTDLAGAWGNGPDTRSSRSMAWIV